jgi:uncharacterized phosphosugar-binding protein
MIIPRYTAAVRSVVDFLETRQTASIEAAAELVANALRRGGTVNCSEIGHGIQGDFLGRAGGLFAVQPFSYSISVHNPLPESRRKAQPADPDEDLKRVRTALAHSSLRAGDVMLVASVSGRNRAPVELALACRERGLGVIGFTSMAYTEKVTSLHPTGKRLYEAVDVVVDCGAPYGDAGVEVPGYDVTLIPMSGLGMLVAGWLIWGSVMEKMAAAGTPASVYISHNREGGPAFNEIARAHYQEKGY